MPLTNVSLKEFQENHLKMEQPLEVNLLIMEQQLEVNLLIMEQQLEVNLLKMELQPVDNPLLIMVVLVQELPVELINLMVLI